MPLSSLNRSYRQYGAQTLAQWWSGHGNIFKFISMIFTECELCFEGTKTGNTVSYIIIHVISWINREITCHGTVFHGMYGSELTVFVAQLQIEHNLILLNLKWDAGDVRWPRLHRLWVTDTVWFLEIKKQDPIPLSAWRLHPYFESRCKRGKEDDFYTHRFLKLWKKITKIHTLTLHEYIWVTFSAAQRTNTVENTARWDWYASPAYITSSHSSHWANLPYPLTYFS